LSKAYHPTKHIIGHIGVDIGRKGRDGRKKKIDKANEIKGKVKGGKDDEVNG